MVCQKCNSQLVLLDIPHRDTAGQIGFTLYLRCPHRRFAMDRHTQFALPTDPRLVNSYLQQFFATTGLPGNPR